MVVDGKRVLIGSHNWSSLGVTLNRDASLIFHDDEIVEILPGSVRDRLEARFSDPIIPEAAVAAAPRLADPESPVPPGFRRLTLEEFLEG